MFIHLSRRRAIGLSILASAEVFLWTCPASGQTWTPINSPTQNQAVLNANSGVNAQGVISVNIASGNNNQQSRDVVIAQGNTALTSAIAEQRLDAGPGTVSASSAYLGANAFAGAKGLLSVNISAGNDNQEANIALVGIGLTGSATSDAMLSQSRARTGDLSHKEGGSVKTDSAEVAPSAFGGSQGLLQVNLIAGERNSSANIFALTMSAGGQK